MNDPFSNPIHIEVNGVLDLHHFSPKDIKFLVPDYLLECIKTDIFEVRIIHGKGSGTLRRTVHAILDKIENVTSYSIADETRGSWGATIVYLRDNKEIK